MSSVDPHFSTTNSCYITLDWILVSHHPDDVITFSPNSPPDLDLGDIFPQPPAEEILHLVYNIKNTQNEQDYYLPSNDDANCARRLKARQSNSVHTPPTSIPNEHIQ